MIDRAEASTSGRYLVLLHEHASGAGLKALRERAGVEVVSSRGAPAGPYPDAPAGPYPDYSAGTGVVFEELGVAVISAATDAEDALGATAASEDAIVALEPERIVQALDEASAAPVPDPGPREAVEARATWGLRVTGVLQARFSGRGVRLAVLDTGLDLAHADFAGRRVEHRSFVSGESIQDGHGHGTHCIGTACGPRDPDRGPRYGIAYEAEIWVGKVLGNDGGGVDGGILAGINWAVGGGCRVVSMSLGAPAALGEPYSRVFEAAARRARRRGTLVIAAAGNDSDRGSGVVSPVSHPANCPSIVAVAALDRRLAVASFSNGGLDPNGGQVDLAAPGVEVRSAWPMPARYRVLSGTSMATPHVAGIAALQTEAAPRASADAVLATLSGTTHRLPLPYADVGAGLVQAP